MLIPIVQISGADLIKRVLKVYAKADVYAKGQDPEVLVQRYYGPTATAAENGTIRSDCRETLRNGALVIVAKFTSTSVDSEPTYLLTTVGAIWPHGR